MLFDCINYFVIFIYDHKCNCVLYQDLKRRHKDVNKVYFSDQYRQYLCETGPLNCKFPWCEDVTVDRRFWESLVCLDPKRQGWLLDEASNITSVIHPIEIFYFKFVHTRLCFPIYSI